MINLGNPRIFVTYGEDRYFAPYLILLFKSILIGIVECDLIDIDIL